MKANIVKNRVPFIFAAVLIVLLALAISAFRSESFNRRADNQKYEASEIAKRNAVKVGMQEKRAKAAQLEDYYFRRSSALSAAPVDNTADYYFRYSAVLSTGEIVDMSDFYLRHTFVQMPAASY